MYPVALKTTPPYQLSAHCRVKRIEGILSETGGCYRRNDSMFQIQNNAPRGAQKGPAPTREARDRRGPTRASCARVGKFYQLPALAKQERTRHAPARLPCRALACNIRQFLEFTNRYS